MRISASSETMRNMAVQSQPQAAKAAPPPTQVHVQLVEGAVSGADSYERSAPVVDHPPGIRVAAATRAWLNRVNDPLDKFVDGSVGQPSDGVLV